MPARKPGRPRGSRNKHSAPKPRTCRFCGEKHYVSIVCDAKQQFISEAADAARPEVMPWPDAPKRPPAPEPAPVPAGSMPSFGRYGMFGHQAHQAGALRIGPARPFQNVTPDPSWGK